MGNCNTKSRRTIIECLGHVIHPERTREALANNSFKQFFCTLTARHRYRLETSPCALANYSFHVVYSSATLIAHLPNIHSTASHLSPLPSHLSRDPPLLLSILRILRFSNTPRAVRIQSRLPIFARYRIKHRTRDNIDLKDTEKTSREITYRDDGETVGLRLPDWGRGYCWCI